MEKLNERSLLLAFVIIIMLSAGCTDTSSDEIDVEDRLIGTKLTGLDSGASYLDEFESEIVFTVSLGIDEHLTSMTLLVRWNDEPPVQSGGLYYNEGEQFTATITNGDGINKMGSTTNSPDREGYLFLHLPGDVVDNQTVPRPLTYTAEIKIILSGDHHPYASDSEMFDVEDTGNAYTWSVEYEYVDKSR